MPSKTNTITKKIQKTASYDSSQLFPLNNKKVLLYNKKELAQASIVNWRQLLFHSIEKEKLYLWVSEPNEQGGETSKQWQVFNAFLKFSPHSTLNFSQQELKQLVLIKYYHIDKKKGYAENITQLNFINALYNNSYKTTAIKNLYWLCQNPNIYTFLKPFLNTTELPVFANHIDYWKQLFEEEKNYNLIDFYITELKSKKNKYSYLNDIYNYIVAVKQYDELNYQEKNKLKQKTSIL